jgi:hypothetical protein
MIWDRKLAFDTISRTLAMTRLDIEHHQAINDLSLHIHGENYFRDVFNFVFDRNFINANTESSNSEYIDLVDYAKKELIQITTTKTADKVRHSLKALKVEKYKDYKIIIFYLLEKPKISAKVKKELEEVYSVKLDELLLDYKYLIRKIESLEEIRLIELAETYFNVPSKKYTDEIVLDLTCKKLMAAKHKMPARTYDDDFGSIEATKKITINNINPRIRHNILGSLDYTSIVESIDNGELGTNLRQLIVHTLYKEVLLEQLKAHEEKTVLLSKDTLGLQEIAVRHDLDFSKLMNALHANIESLLEIKDFNSMNIAWILVAYFFEICDVGGKKV